MFRILTIFIIVILPVTAFAQVLVNDITLHDQALPAVASDGDFVYVAFQDGSTFQYDARVAVSVDGGVSFSPSALPYEPNEEDQEMPDLAVGPDGALYVVWADWRNQSDYDIYLAASGDHGQSFSPPVRVNAETHGTQVEPSIAVGSNGDIYVTWADNRRTTAEDSGVRWDVFAAISDDGALSFHNETALNHLDEYFALFPEVAATPEGAVVTWFDLYPAIQAAATFDGGETWNAPIRLDLDNNARVLLPRIAADENGVVAIAWNDSTESGAGQDPDLITYCGMTMDLYGVISEDGGATWATSSRFNEEPMLDQRNPALSFDGEELLIAWTDDRDVGDFRIRGVTTQSPWVWPIASQQWDGYDGVAVRDWPDLSGRALVWQDYRNGDWDIRFARIGGEQ